MNMVSSAPLFCLACACEGPSAGMRRHAFTCAGTFQAWPGGAGGITTMHAMLAEQELAREAARAQLKARVAELEAELAGRL